MVYFVGGGVGDADFLTLKAVKILKKADVVVYSQCLDDSVFRFCSRKCRFVMINSMSREDMNAFLLREKDKCVVYVVEGSFACFSTTQDRFDFCRRNGIAFSVIPGVSSLEASASAVANELLVPFVSNGLLVTYFDGPGNPLKGQTIEKWAGLGVSMAIFMVKPEEYPLLKRRLLDGGMEGDVPAVVVQDALRDKQKVVFTTVDGLDAVGEVSWFSVVLLGRSFSNLDGSYGFSFLLADSEFRRAEDFMLRERPLEGVVQC